MTIIFQLLIVTTSMESINFVHDVNVMRKTLKSIYANSEDLRALNSEGDTGPGNCKVQVLPVCWRHMLDFPKQRGNGRELDLGDADAEEDNCEQSSTHIWSRLS
jgi:hypothetical protein